MKEPIIVHHITLGTPTGSPLVMEFTDGEYRAIRHYADARGISVTEAAFDLLTKALAQIAKERGEEHLLEERSN